MPRIAVVIPTYERTTSLVRAVRSVLRQTLRPAELIVVDDGSTAPVADLLADLPEVRVVVNSRRMGAAFSRNRGVQASSSELVAFLDSDDFWAETKLEAQHARFVARPEVDLVYCDQYLVTADGRRLPSGKKLISEDILGHLLQFWTAPNTSTLMLRRASFERLGGFDETLASCQDHDLWMRVAQQGLVVDCVREALSFFCFDQDQRISAHYRDRMAGVEAFLDKWRELIVTRAGPTQFRRFRNRYYVTASFSVFTSLLKSGRAEALIVFWRYLAANPAFYAKALERLLAPHRISGTARRVASR